jgi:hypothetical protein
MQIAMVLKGIILDPVSNMPVLILQQEGATRYLPIWIGIFEANAIAMKLDSVTSPRPMTHDLFNAVLDKLGARIVDVLISALEDNIFFAVIRLRVGESEHLIDCRPSDAIALAVRSGCPIFADSTVLERAQSIDISSEGDEAEKLRRWLEDLDPESLGKYKM